MLKALFDDHYEAFPTWREAGLKNLVCLHVDAHLDVMEDGFCRSSLAAIAQAQSSAELEVFRDKDGPWGGSFHCGNYLYPALRDGTVSELIWLVPPHVIRGEDAVESVRAELNHWVDLPLADYSSLRLQEGAVRGTLFSLPFTVCTSEHLPALSPDQAERLVLDIDVDYFVRSADDVLWQTPHELARELSGLSPRALTVAISREGGYTPAREQYLGQVCLDVFGGRPALWQREVADIQAADTLLEPARTQRWLELLADSEPLFEAALLARLGRWEEAVALDPTYQNRTVDRASRCLEKRSWAEGLEILKQVQKDDLEARQLEFFLRTRSGDLLGAREIFEELMESVELVGFERLKILQLGGENYRKLGEHELALKVYREGLKLAPENASLHYNLALVYKAAGDSKRATRALRKSMRLSTGRLSYLAALAKASSWYQEMGQHALAHAARIELKKLDVTGEHVIKVMLEQASRKGRVS